MNAKNTTYILKQLRALMKNTQYVPEALHAYVILSEDAHQNEYLADHDKRREYVSGFKGSAGTAVITDHYACMWTDGRYFLQASKEMDDNWTLMKEGVAGTPTKGEWLVQTLQLGSRVGIDPKIMSYNNYRRLQVELEPYGLVLIPTPTNLVDVIWNDQPPLPQAIVSPLHIRYTGLSSSEKIRNIREKMTSKGASLLLLTALDEIAWTLNLRGSDIPYNPVFFSYLIITQSDVVLFIDESKINPTLYHHFSDEGLAISYKPYSGVQSFLAEWLTTDIGKSERSWISHDSSLAFVNLIPDNRRISTLSPVAFMKAIKNSVEIRGILNAHVKDAAALCRYFNWLEKEVPKGTITEITGADQLERFRKEQDDFIGLSFETISSVGPNAAVIHYKPAPETDRIITTSELYLCDSGGQYRDGTTDVTRTLHFGTPSEYEKECFTRVLKGFISIATALFPEKVKGNVLDTLARKYLWDVGLNYMHGTGHGIGAYLNVHEGPMGISWRPYPDDPGLDEGMFLSDEPGYYEDGKFGIRIENIVRIVSAQPKYQMNGNKFLTFDTVTLVPIQRKMLLPNLLTDEEISFLNAYHSLCRDKVGRLLQQQGHHDALKWLLKETAQIG